MAGTRLKLYMTEKSRDKLNASLLSRFFVPEVFEDSESLLAALPGDCEVVIFHGNDCLDDALSVSGNTACAVLLVADESEARVLNKCTLNGVLYCTVSDYSKYISPLYAMRVRLAAIENSNNKLQRKLDDTKLVNRAKLLLMKRLNMTESQAHKYIEKTAMDSCSSKKDVAVRIIKTYED